MARIVLPEEVRVRVETSLMSITEEALRGRIRQVMLHAARILEWKRLHGWLACPRCGVLAAPSDTETSSLCELCRAGVS